VEALTKLARKDDKMVVVALVRLLEDAPFRHIAIRALREVACRGDAAVLKALCRLLDDDDCGVRADAAAALGELANEGDGKVSVALLTLLLLEDEIPHVRQTAATALGRTATRRNATVVAALSGLHEKAEIPHIVALAAAVLVQIESKKR